MDISMCYQQPYYIRSSEKSGSSGSMAKQGNIDLNKSYNSLHSQVLAFRNSGRKGEREITGSKENLTEDNCYDHCLEQRAAYLVLILSH